MLRFKDLAVGFGGLCLMLLLLLMSSMRRQKLACLTTILAVSAGLLAMSRLLQSGYDLYDHA